jgi:three-Cys-motif partner protein
MTPEHQFGGAWTDEKLERVRKYLCAYTAIFRGNEKARYLRTTYVDAFAGTGRHIPSGAHPVESRLIPEVDTDPEASAFKKGSAAIALDVQPDFDRYIFIEVDADKAEDLNALRVQHADKSDRIRIVRENANGALMRFARETDWDSNRAVVFLDPYGMSVEWSTIEALGQTKAVDLWVLFPLGQAVNRLLMKRQLPPEGWSDALTRCFGTDEWKAEFYEPSAQMSLLDEAPSVEKIATFKSISDFFKRRLATCFCGVADTSLRLCNSRNSPLFLLCFASANEKGAKTAIKIADHILGGS